MNSECELLNLRDSLIRDMVIIGTKDKKLQERLLRKPDTTLDEAVKQGKTSEASRQHKEILNPSNRSNLYADVINHRMRKDQKRSENNWSESSSSRNCEDRSKKYEKKPEMIMSCQFCSYQHKRGKCPAYNKTCMSCGGQGHFAKCY